MAPFGKEQRELQRLAGADRVGRHARNLAWKRASAEIRRDWPLLTFVVVFPFLIFLASTPFLKQADRWFILGVLSVTGPFLAVGMVLLFSGATTPLMGLYGEEWTAQQFRSMKKNGWRLVNGLQLRSREDIDHVAIGHGGVFVVETKWSSDSWPMGESGDGFNRSALEGALKQVKRNLRDFSWHFKKELGEITAQPVCVLWSSNPSGEPEAIQIVDGVLVVPGPLLRRWLSDLAMTVVDDDRIEVITTAVAKHASGRDEFDERSGKVVHDSLRRFIGEPVVAGMAGGLVGFYGSVVLDHFLRRWQGMLIVIVVFLLVGMISLRLTAQSRRIRRWMRAGIWGWTIASLLVAVLYLGILVEFLSRWI